jgi:hypothetical protein
MRLLSYGILGLYIIYFLDGCKNGTYEGKITEWRIDNIESISGIETEVLGSPMIIESPLGKAVEFNGITDALIVSANPLTGWKRFTIEVLFRPDPDGEKEQRFIHIQENDDHRVLIETRVTDDGSWFFDTYIKSGQSDCTLYANDFLHAVGKWYHAALIYDGKKMYHFVNGEQELEGDVTFKSMQMGKTSIGCRLNKVYWYKGAIARINFSPHVLSRDKFSLLNLLPR